MTSRVDTLYILFLVNVLLGRELSGPVSRSLVCPARYSNLQLQRQTLGHLSAVYCLMFDHSGKYIITVSIHLEFAEISLDNKNERGSI